MSNAIEDDQDEKPLDPAMEKVRRKMVRLLAVSIGIMFVGVMAVMGAIVYKFTRPSPQQAVVASSQGVPSDAPVEAVAALPAGFTIVGIALDGNRIAFNGRMADGKLRVMLYDITTSRIVADIAVINRP